MAKEDVLAVIDSATKLNYEEWFKISAAISKAFEEKERRLKSGIKLDDSERVKYFYSIP